MIFLGFLFTIIALFFYSYTQVDLNLTLSQWSIWQVVQTSFQQVGWFNRPLSTALYLVIVLCFFTFYLVLLAAIRKNKLPIKKFWLLVLVTSGILLFSYNAFSYDLFNYMFDARIVTLHGENPYMHKALDYPGDPWINFMRWTHRTYPYGPVWLGLTIPLSFLGFQFFLPTLFLFKSLMVGAFLGSIYFIGKILEKLHPKEKLFGMAIFAFNPLMLIESLVSGHHDIVMILFLLMSIYTFMSTNYVRSLFMFVLSIGIKFATLALLPVVLWIGFKKVRKEAINWEKIFFVSLILSCIAIILASFRTEFQPWYLIWALPFVALLPDNGWLVKAAAIVSCGLLLQYVPFLYTGNWDSPIPIIKLGVNIISLLLAGGVIAWYGRKKMVQYLR